MTDQTTTTMTTTTMTTASASGWADRLVARLPEGWRWEIKANCVRLWRDADERFGVRFEAYEGGRYLVGGQSVQGLRLGLRAYRDAAKRAATTHCEVEDEAVLEALREACEDGRVGEADYDDLEAITMSAAGFEADDAITAETSDDELFDLAVAGAIFFAEELQCCVDGIYSAYWDRRDGLRDCDDKGGDQ